MAGPKPEISIDEALIEEIRQPFDLLSLAPCEHRYVAFIDLLGFSSAVTNSFQETLKFYERLIGRLRLVRCFQLGVSIEVVSDAIVLTGEHLDPVLSICKLTQWVALLEGGLVRGGIGYGRHVDVTDSPNRYYVSEALVNAVNVEKSIGWPCIGLHRDIPISEDHWLPHNRAISRTLVHFRGVTLVCPLNLFWGSTAIDRVEEMKRQFPEHSAKYDWYLSLCNAILSGEYLVPRVGDVL